jgi:hypothetical protein
MGRKCCVVGCKSNYLSTKEYIPVYTFPADKEECARWVAALPFQINNITVHIGVCRKHWPEHTQMKKIKRYLRPAAAPSLFANSTPAMFIQNQPTPSRNILKRKLSLVDRNAQPDELSAFNSIDIIPNWPAFLENLNNSDVVSTHNLHIERHVDSVNLYKISSSVIVFTISIRDNLAVTASHCNTKVFVRDILGYQQHLQRWSQLLAIVARTLSTPLDVKEEILSLIRRGSIYLDDTDTESHDKLSFLFEQISLCVTPPHGRRYSVNLWYAAVRLFLMGQSNYNSLRDVLTLPHPSQIKDRLSTLSTIGSESHAEDLIANYFKTLTEEQRISCIAMFDEIHIKPSERLRGGHSIGKAADDQTKLARTILAVMVKPLRGGCPFVARLVPLYKLQAPFLLGILDSVNVTIEKNGGKVLALVCDNHFINQQCYRTMVISKEEPFLGRFPTTQSSVTLLYDTVHLLKSFRNNWITEGRQELHYTSVVNGETATRKARWSDITSIWKQEHDNVIRETTLTYHACFPTPIERQKVSLVTPIFHDKTIAALQMTDKEDTLELLKKMTHLWKILNVKHPLAHVRLNDPDRRPLALDNADSSSHLEEMLSMFKAMPSGRGPTRVATLTSDTRRAFIQTLSGLIHLSNYLLIEREWLYVLLGQLQSDNLEGEFGVYRQLNGCCYYISVEQVLCAARYREVKLFFNADALDDLPHTTAPCCMSPLSEAELVAADECLVNISSLSSHEISSLYFVAGYIAMKEGVAIVNGGEIYDEVSSEFTRLVSRGKLHHPPEWLFNFSQAAYTTFLNIEERCCINHLSNLFLHILDCFFPDNVSDQSRSVCRRIANCCLKGEIRRTEDSAQVPSDSARKLKKLRSV